MMRVSIPKTEYKALKRQAEAWQKFASVFFASALQDPVESVINDFRKTKLYTKGFLADLASGLRASSYNRHYAHTAATKRSAKIPRTS